MEAWEVEAALRSRAAAVPGGRDAEGRPVLLVTAPVEDRDHLQQALSYIASIYSAETRRGGFCVLVDARRSPWRRARVCLRAAAQAMGGGAALLLVLRPDAFWDKQRVHSCARTPRHGQPVYIPVSKLGQYIDSSQLPEELGGTWPYDHNLWIQNRISVESFIRDGESCSGELDRLVGLLKETPASTMEEVLLASRSHFDAALDHAQRVLYAGENLLVAGGWGCATAADAADTCIRLQALLAVVRGRRAAAQDAWRRGVALRNEARELRALEAGVARVIDLVLGDAERRLNQHVSVGCDVVSAERLRQQHEALELQCRETYGQYAELLHKIDTLPHCDIALPEDLKSQRDFMDFVCRSFATRLERRRNVLITSLRFYRLVSEYFDRTSDVFSTLVKNTNLDDYESAEAALLELQENEYIIDDIDHELVREGEKLSDMLSMPVKDALGRELPINYEPDIVNVQSLLQAANKRRELFLENVHLHKLMLQQIAHIHTYERDAMQAYEWLQDLSDVMLREHAYVGCNVYEIQQQKEELQVLQDTAKGTYEWGSQLLNASLSLRESCKLDTDQHNQLTLRLTSVWTSLHSAQQEQMTRLRVAAVFHRTVDQQCEQLSELCEEASKKKGRLQKVLANRERVLPEVGRMVRLGRLLRSRLKEALCDQQLNEEDGFCANALAVDAISERLAEVTALAEKLDACLQGDAVAPEEWNVKVKSPEGSVVPDGSVALDDKSEDEFVTASECTCTPPSRSSSFHTASEGSPWWELEEPDQPVVKTVTEVTSGVIVEEVTETTTLKLSHSPTLGITSYLLTSETTSSGKPSDEQATSSDARPDESLEDSPDDLAARLRESREALQLKIVETQPELTQLGASLAEALRLQAAHDHVLEQLQNKQSPVEELLRQADQLISNQKPRAEVYAAMAESLGLAWKDVNSHLEQRKRILDLNVAYQSRAEDCLDKMRVLEMNCMDTDVPVEIESVKHLLTKIHDLKKLMLESLMLALQDGKQLLEKLREVAAQGTLDSRPDQIRAAAQHGVSQVEHWLESLHDRRTLLELMWQNRKAQLEQCLALSLLAKDLKELEECLDLQRISLENVRYDLGDSCATAEMLLHEHKKLIPDAKNCQDKCLKITKATERLASSNHFACEQAISQAFTVLNKCAEYVDAIEQREVLLNKAVKFFNLADATLTKFDQLEIQLTTSEMPLTSPQLGKLHEQAAKAIEDLSHSSLQEGYSLIGSVPASALGTDGVRNTIKEIENRKITLEQMCIAHKEENVHLSQALTKFLEQHNELYSWLVSIAEAFLQGHQDMGSVLAMAKDFLQLHQQLFVDMQSKGIEINDLLVTLPPILELLNDDERTDIDNKVDALHSQWLNIKSLLEARIDLAAEYVKFHILAVELASNFDSIEDEFRKTSSTEDNIQHVEEKWLHIQQQYVQLSNLGKSFITRSSQVGDPYLDIKRANLCVETLLEHFGSRQLVVTESWQTWHTNITIEKEFQVLWERNMTESSRTVDWVSKLDTRLYPIITSESSSSKIIIKDLEEKLHTVIPEIKRAQAEIELRIKTAENLSLRGDPLGQKELLTSKLHELNSKLHLVATEYQILLEMLVSFFKNVAELEKTIETLESQYRQTRLPSTLPQIELMVKEHEASRQAVVELFKFTQAEKEQLVNRIRQQEPDVAARHDISRLTRLLEIKQIAWESAWTDRKLQLEQHHQLCQFNSDLQQINSTLNDLSKQLSAIHGQYGESLSNAKATSLAFVYFEKTIEVLEERIKNFIRMAQQMAVNEQATSVHIDSELKKLIDRWQEFHKQVQESRRLIDLSIQYFTLVEEAEEWFREGSKLLVTIARKSTTVKHPQEATQLLNEVELFLKPGEVRQDERIKKISSLAIELYGNKTPHEVTLVLNENKEMLDSFSVISEELTSLAQNLKAAEEERERLKREQQEADASLVAARAEAAAARAAAAAADEARKAAEAAAKALHEATPLLIERVSTEVLKAIPVPAEIEKQKQRSPSPPPKKAKVIEEKIIAIPPIFTIPLHDESIQEGEKFTFQCRVTGVPVPEIIWYKDGISIQNNPDYLTKFEEGLCTLTIEETFTEDSAKFSCKAANSAGVAETSATLTVKETEPEEQLSPPVFTKHLLPSSAKEGSTFEMICNVEGNPLPTTQWYKDEVCIDNSPDYVITFNNGEAIIRFEELFLDDQAEYTCKAVNQLGCDKTTAKLFIEPLEPAEAPVFVTPLTNIMARAGQKIKLECKVSGMPAPDITWSHNNKPFKENRDVKIQFENETATLIIPEAFPKDAGIYTISAKNKAGETTSSCNVSVKGRLPTETSDSELASDMEPIKPSIQLPLKDISVFEGKKVRLDCVIVGQPEPEVIWYHDERPVKESPDFQLLFQGDRCSLIIREAYIEDAGEYKVVAINSGGEASSKCSLSVKSIGETEPLTRIHTVEVEMKETGSPPKFNKLLSDILATEGDTITLESVVVGDPKPIVKWFLNNNEIKSDNHREFHLDDEGNASLKISSVTTSDRGVYTIKAHNPNGDAKCFANLIVKSSTTSRTDVPFEEKLTMPAFKELFADRSVPENGPTRFECIVIGKPVPKVKWLFNDQPVSGKDFLISVSGERQVLFIPEVKKDHTGTIACVAENEVGKATCVAKLNVEEPLFTIQESVGTTQHLESSYSVKKSVFVQSSSQTMSSSTDKNEPHVEVHKFSSESQHSMQKTGQEPPSEVQSNVTYEMHQVNQEKPHIKQHTFLKVSNKVEEQESSTVTVTAPVSSPKPVRKSVAPRFITPLNGKIVDQGSDVVLECVVDGFPSPHVEWTKNGQKVVPNPDVLLVSLEMNHAKLELKNVGVKDAGRYTCTATNDCGSASSTADVVIKKTIFPPVFGRRLQAQIAKAGERVVMEVEVTGTPDPTVNWFKDGELLNSTDSSSPYKIKKMGSGHSLVIERAALNNTGKYSVKAVNSGGEAQCVADFVVLEPEPNVEIIKETKQTIYEDIIQTRTEQYSQGSKLVQDSKTEIPSSLLKSKLSPSNTLPLTTESYVVTETNKTDQHLTLKIERSPSPFVKQDSKLNEKSAEKVFETEKAISAQTETLAEDKEMKSDYIIDDKLKEEESGIEKASISKQSALEYFASKIKDEEQATKLAIKPVSTILQKQPSEKSSHFVTEKSLFETSIKHESDTMKILEEEFGLQPEPPPEICFVPKMEVQEKKDESISFKMKRLEESHRDLTPVEIPSGAVKIFPSPNSEHKSTAKPEEGEKIQNIQIEPAIQKEAVEEVCIQQIIQRPGLSDASQPKKTKEKLYPELADTVEPISGISSEHKTSVIMDTTTSARSETIKESFQKSSTLGIYEKNDQTRSVSPKPTAEGLAMEKLWSPHKPVDHEIPFQKSTPTRTFVKDSSPKPSMEGLAMDKIWAHKHPDSALKNVWPPPQPSAEKVTIPWAATGSIEKSWPPSTTISEKELTVSMSHQDIQTTKITDEQIVTDEKPEIKEIPQTKPVETVTHYVSESKYFPPQTQMKDETTSSSAKIEVLSKSEHVEHTVISHESAVETLSSSVVEEKVLKPSEAKKLWPPVTQEIVEVHHPVISKTAPPLEKPINYEPPDETELILEPGPPPEIGYAKPPLERRQSYVETIEQDLEKDLDKEPSRHLPGAVRTMPPPKDKTVSPCSSPLKEKKPFKFSTLPKAKISTKKTEIRSSSFDRFPDLDPLPFTPDPPKPKHAKLPPPPKPSKFIKGDFASSDYESDFESIRIPSKWRPYESDTEELQYRKVKPPSFTQPTRPRSTDPEPLAPSHFDKPPQFTGPPRPDISSITRQTTTEVTKKSSKVETKFEKTKKHNVVPKKKHSPPLLKPGSPPKFIQSSPQEEDLSKVKPESPKSKNKLPKTAIPESGYMADTDEPRIWKQNTHKTSMKQEETVKETFEQTTLFTEKHSHHHTQTIPDNLAKASPSKPTFPSQSKVSQLSKKNTLQTSTEMSTVKADKEIGFRGYCMDIPKQTLHISQINLDTETKEIPTSREITHPKRPPPPSPTRFIKGEFRESDYESDYDGRIASKWRPHDSDAEEPLYRPVRPVLTPRPTSRTSTDARSPTPPTEFDVPPQISGQLRPKFSPIEKPVQLNKSLKTTVSTEKTQAVLRPKPLTPKTSTTDLVVAAPSAILKPGSPPEMQYAPPPQSSQKPHINVKLPFSNATQMETSNVMNFSESTEHSHRVVNVQQTTRVITFGDKSKVTSSERHDDVPKPNIVTQKKYIPPPITPKKFIPGDFHESDYESDVEKVRIKPKWVPYDSDSEEPQYRKVKPPQIARSSSVPPKPSVRVSTPMEFDTQPPYMPLNTTTNTSEVMVTSSSEKRSEQRQIQKVLDIRKQSGGQEPISKKHSEERLSLQPGEPPEFILSGQIPANTTYAASKHMNEMTQTFKSKAQQFVDTIMTDVKKSDKPAPSVLPKKEPHAVNGGSEPQVYRDESRLSEFGTKHIDPDTGLIYFKYDFGYEFGVVLPGEGKKGATTKRARIDDKRDDDIEVPIIHETSASKVKSEQQKESVTPKKFTRPKTGIWEPTSESEMSEAEDSVYRRKRFSLPQVLPESLQKEPQIMIPTTSHWDQASPSPLSTSLSPSLPSFSPHIRSITPSMESSVSPGKGPRAATPNSPVVRATTPGSQQKKPPTFITPLRDIAVVSGQCARFECIVQAEPPPNILWSKNGRILENSQDYQIQFRNGVCRLTIPQAFPEDAGVYTCTATNMVGTVGSSGTLQVPGVPSHMYGTYRQLHTNISSSLDWDSTITSLMTDVAGLDDIGSTKL